MMLVVVIIHVASLTSVMVAALKRLDARLTRVARPTPKLACANQQGSSLDSTFKLADTPVLGHFLSIRQPIPTACLRSSELANIRALSGTL